MITFSLICEILLLDYKCFMVVNYLSLIHVICMCCVVVQFFVNTMWIYIITLFLKIKSVIVKVIVILFIMYVIINLFNYIMFMVDIMMSSNFTASRIRRKFYSLFLFEYDYSYMLLHSVMRLLQHSLIQGTLILIINRGQHRR